MLLCKEPPYKGALNLLEFRKQIKRSTVPKYRTNRRNNSMAKANAKFMAPLTPSAELAVIVGSAALPRTEVVKKMWEYIKKNGLQDAKNKRMINADAKLAPIFEGKKQISMFDMSKYISKHLSK